MPPALRNSRRCIVTQALPKIMDRFFNPQVFVKEKDRVGQPLPDAKEALGNLFRIAWPSMCESFLIALVSLADTIMVGVEGSAAIAAVGLTNQPRFIVLALFMSLNVGITAVVSRRRGENDLIVDARRIGDLLQQVAFVAVQRPFVELLNRYDVGVERLDYAGEILRIRL